MLVFNLSQVPERIRKYRKEAGLTQTELAQRCGLSRVSIASYETGRVVTPYEKIELIAKALNRQLEDFVITDSINMEPKIELLVNLIESLGYFIELDPGVSMEYLPGYFSSNKAMYIVHDGEKTMVYPNDLLSIIDMTQGIFKLQLLQLIQEKENDGK